MIGPELIANEKKPCESGGQTVGDSDPPRHSDFQRAVADSFLKNKRKES